MRCVQCGKVIDEGDLFCPHCGAQAQETGSGKASDDLPSSARVPGRTIMSSRAKGVYAAIAAILLLAMGVIFVRSLPGGGHPVIMNQPTVSESGNLGAARLVMTPVAAKVENGFIIVSLKEISEKRMVSFTYEGRSKTIAMMAYINPEGKLVTSIAMCEPCNSKSFHSEGGDLVCDNCGTRWSFATLEGVSGTCQKYPPDPIPSSVVGDEVRISTTLVDNWKMRI